MADADAPIVIIAYFPVSMADAPIVIIANFPLSMRKEHAYVFAVSFRNDLKDDHSKRDDHLFLKS